MGTPPELTAIAKSTHLVTMQKRAARGGREIALAIVSGGFNDGGECGEPV